MRKSCFLVNPPRLLSLCCLHPGSYPTLNNVVDAAPRHRGRPWGRVHVGERIATTIGQGGFIDLLIL